MFFLHHAPLFCIRKHKVFIVSVRILTKIKFQFCKFVNLFQSKSIVYLILNFSKKCSFRCHVIWDTDYIVSTHLHPPHTTKPECIAAHGVFHGLVCKRYDIVSDDARSRLDHLWPCAYGHGSDSLSCLCSYARLPAHIYIKRVMNAMSCIFKYRWGLTMRTNAPQNHNLLPLRVYKCGASTPFRTQKGNARVERGICA